MNPANALDAAGVNRCDGQVGAVEREAGTALRGIESECTFDRHLRCTTLPCMFPPSSAVSAPGHSLGQLHQLPDCQVANRCQRSAHFVLETCGTCIPSRSSFHLAHFSRRLSSLGRNTSMRAALPLLGLVLACTLQAAAVLAANCTVGVDIATPASVASFQCMMANGIQHVTVRSFQSNCWLDPHAAQTMKNAWEAGLVVDTYIFPSVGCDLDPTSQVQVTLDHLKAEGANFNTLWLDVEDWGWGPIVDCDANQAAIRPMLEYAIQTLGVERVGIYSMETMWHRIMCNTTEWNATLMWWAHWSGGESFDDYYEGQSSAWGSCSCDSDEI
jgi:hypothetical protein